MNIKENDMVKEALKKATRIKDDVNSMLTSDLVECNERIAGLKRTNTRLLRVIGKKDKTIRRMVDMALEAAYVKNE